MKITTAQHFHTSGDISKALGRPFSRVRWILGTRDIQPVGRAGIIRLYDDAAVERVRAELETADKRLRRMPSE